MAHVGYGVNVAGGRGCTPNEPVASCGRGRVCDLEVLRTEHVEDVSPYALNAMVFDKGWERSSTCR